MAQEKVVDQVVEDAVTAKPETVVTKQSEKSQRQIQKTSKDIKEEKIMVQQALGLVETRGLVAAIEAADAML